MILHPLPKGYSLATGKAEFFDKQLLLRLKAFMPAGHGYLRFNDDDDTDSDSAYEHFEETVCKHCDYYFEDYVDDGSDIEDDDGNPAISVAYKSRCPCKADGINYVCWPCAKDHDDPADSPPHYQVEGPLPPMAYAVDLRVGSHSTGQMRFTLAHMQAVDTATQQVSGVFRSMNTYGDHTVCWGNDNDNPQTLPEMIDQYIETPANEDLLKAHEYTENRQALRAQELNKPIAGIVIPPGCDAALMVSAAYQPAAFLLLRGTGFPSSEGVLAIGLRRHSLLHDGQWLDGYCTTPIDGRCWFVLPNPDVTEDPDLQYQALLLSQIPDPFSACSSPTPLSLAPVALAAS